MILKINVYVNRSQDNSGYVLGLNTWREHGGDF